MDFIKLLETFLVGIVGSFVGAMVGSGGLVSIPFLIFLGLPPQMAIATHKFGAVGLKVGAVVRFWRTNQIQWSYFIPLSLLSLVAAIIGAQLLLTIDKEILSRTVAIFLVVTLPLLFANKETGVIHKSTSFIMRGLGYFFYFLAQVFGAFFGGGGATIVFYVLMTFFGLTIVEASATSMLPSLIMNVCALVIFGFNDILNFDFGLAIFLGMLIGGWLGAHTAVKKGNKWVKILFAIVVIIAALKLFIG